MTSLDVSAIDAERLRRELRRVAFAARTQQIAPRRHVADRKRAVALDPAAVVLSDLRASARGGSGIRLTLPPLVGVPSGFITRPAMRESAHQLQADVDVDTSWLTPTVTARASLTDVALG